MKLADFKHLAEQLQVYTQEKFPNYVYFCLDNLVLPITLAVFVLFVLGYVDFFYEYSTGLLFVGTTMLVLAFVPFFTYLWKYKG